MQDHHAFPSNNDADKFYNFINKGMTVREYLVASALKGLLAKEGVSINSQLIANYACDVADKVLTILEKEQN